VLREADVAATARAEAERAAKAAVSERSAVEKKLMRAVLGKELQPGAWHLLAAAAVALVTGIGIGTWLGKSPEVPPHSSANEPGELRLRLDYQLANPPPEVPRSIPRD
jgi:hypothetical protein